MPFKLIIALLALVTAVTSYAESATCTQTTPGLSQFYNAGWGIDLGNQRFQEQTTITAGNARSLSLSWTYGFASKRPRVFPLVTEDTIFIGDGGRGLIALDRATGCQRWVNTDIEDIGTAISHGEIEGRTVLVFTGRTTGVIAVDAATGKELWRHYVDHRNRGAMINIMTP